MNITLAHHTNHTCVTEWPAVTLLTELALFTSHFTLKGRFVVNLFLPTTGNSCITQTQDHPFNSSI